MDTASLEQLADLIRTYFHRSDGRGKHCVVESCRRGELDYFFAYPEEYSQQQIEWVKGTFDQRPHNPTFEVSDETRQGLPKSGRTGRVNIEVASSHYRDPSIRAKSSAGFAIHATGAAKARVLKALRSGRSEGNDGTNGPAQRAPTAFEL